MLAAEEVSFRHRPGAPLVLDGVSLGLAPGEVVGLAGPSGAGKSTLGRILAGFLDPEAGRVLLDGRPLPSSGFSPVQMLFQSAELAVNPRWTIRRILHEAYVPREEDLAAFGVRAAWLERYPHELSGGELQRIAIVRTLHPELRFLVADEISGMLDAIAQAEIWGALLRLAGERKIGILAIAHNAALLDCVATRRLALRNGRLWDARLKSVPDERRA